MSYDEDEEAFEHTLLAVREVSVFKIPPRPTSGGYKCGEWLQSDKIWTGCLRVVSCNSRCEIRLEDPSSGDLFAACFVNPGQREITVEPALDSSRHFVLRIEDGRGKHAFIGLGFNERNEAFDFNVALSDHEKYVKREVEKEAGGDGAGEGGKDVQIDIHQGESKKPRKTKKKNRRVKDELASDNLLESRGQDDHDEVYQMSSGDEDCSKGMKKWITQYYQSRPGIKVLQERIDDFIMAHEAEEEKARLEREAQAAEGGWTVVVHHKGRKKTTDAETGVAVGSVAQAAVVDKVAKKKTKEVGIDFYQFHKREAHRNEIMMLQSKFEQDKKRIQMRAARKFRSY